MDSIEHVSVHPLFLVFEKYFSIPCEISHVLWLCYAQQKSNSSSGINSVGAKHSKAPTHISYLLNRSLSLSAPKIQFLLTRWTHEKSTVCFGLVVMGRLWFNQKRKKELLNHKLKIVHFKWKLLIMIFTLILIEAFFSVIPHLETYVNKVLLTSTIPWLINSFPFKVLVLKHFLCFMCSYVGRIMLYIFSI